MSTHTHASVTRSNSEATAIAPRFYGMTITALVGNGFVITDSPAVGGMEATTLYNSTTGEQVQVSRWLCECKEGK